VFLPQVRFTLTRIHLGTKRRLKYGKGRRKGKDRRGPEEGKDFARKTLARNFLKGRRGERGGLSAKGGDGGGVPPKKAADRNKEAGSKGKGRKKGVHLPRKRVLRRLPGCGPRRGAMEKKGGEKKE